MSENAIVVKMKNENDIQLEIEIESIIPTNINKDYLINLKHFIIKDIQDLLNCPSSSSSSYPTELDLEISKEELMVQKIREVLEMNIKRIFCISNLKEQENDIKCSSYCLISQDYISNQIGIKIFKFKLIGSTLETVSFKLLPKLVKKIKDIPIFNKLNEKIDSNDDGNNNDKWYKNHWERANFYFDQHLFLHAFYHFKILLKQFKCDSRNVDQRKSKKKNELKNELTKKIKSYRIMREIITVKLEKQSKIRDKIKNSQKPHKLPLKNVNKKIEELLKLNDIDRPKLQTFDLEKVNIPIVFIDLDNNNNNNNNNNKIELTESLMTQFCKLTKILIIQISSYSGRLHTIFTSINYSLSNLLKKKMKDSYFFLNVAIEFEFIKFHYYNFDCVKSNSHFDKVEIILKKFKEEQELNKNKILSLNLLKLELKLYKSKLHYCMGGYINSKKWLKEIINDCNQLRIKNFTKGKLKLLKNFKECSKVWISILMINDGYDNDDDDDERH